MNYDLLDIEYKDMTFEQAKEYWIDSIRRSSCSNHQITNHFKDRDFLENLLEELRTRFNVFKSGNFEAYYVNNRDLDDLILMPVGVPKSQKFFDDYIEHIYKTRSKEEIDEFWKYQEYEKAYYLEYDRILGELIKERKNIRFDPEVL